MAEELVVQLVVNSEEAKKQLEEFAKKLESTKKEVTKPVPKDKGLFGGKFSGQIKDIQGIIGDLLPRDIKNLQRSFKGAQRSTQSFTKGLKGMKAAIASTGIGLLVVALGELVANWDKITGAINSASDQSNKLVESANEMRQQADAQYDAINATTNQLLLQGKTEEEIQAMREKALDDQILAAQMQIEYTRRQAEEQEKVVERNKKIAMALLKTLEIPITAILELVDGVTGLLAKAGLMEEQLTLSTDFFNWQAEKLGFDVEETAQENDERIAKAEEDLNRLVEQRAANQVRRKKEKEAEDKKRKADNDRLKADQKKFLDELLMTEEDYGKSQEELAVIRLKRQQAAEMERAKELKLSQEEIEKLTAQHQRALTDLEEEQAKKRREAEESERDMVENALKTDLQRDLDAARDKYARLLEVADKYGLDRKALEDKLNAELKDIRDRANEQEQKDDEANKRLGIQRMNDFVSTIGGLFGTWQDLVKSQTDAEVNAAKARGATEEEIEKIERAAAERQKRLALIEILINQAQAIASGLQGASAAASATGPAAPFVLPAYIASMVATIVGGFVQVKNLMNKANAASSSVGGGSGGGSRSVTQALPNLVSDLQNKAGTFGQEQSFKTYVVASDVQGQISDYGSINQNASL